MKIAIVGNGPKSHLPNLKTYINEVDCWIGADRGAFHIIEAEIQVDHALGDFDSVTEAEKASIIAQTETFHPYPSRKDETDLELAIEKALAIGASEILLFGVTGARLDHGLINIQILYPLLQKNIAVRLIDYCNDISLKGPGNYSISKNNQYPYVSFVAFTERVIDLTLSEAFEYPLEKATLTWGSTLCISNEINADEAQYSFSNGYVLVIQSKDGQ